jgi:hypothetical protein
MSLSTMEETSLADSNNEGYGINKTVLLLLMMMMIFQLMHSFV